MYSDARTIPFRVVGDDAPTQLLTAPAVATATRPADPPKTPTAPLVVLLVVGSLLLATLLVAIAVIAGRGAPGPVTASAPGPVGPGPAIDIDDAAPPAAEVPTDSPPAPAPDSIGPRIDTFASSNDTVLCNTQSPSPSTQYISFSWSVSDATRVYFGIDTTDASVAPLFDNLPLTGTSTSDFPAGYNDFTYGCPAAAHSYTLTAVDSTGGKVNHTVHVANHGDTI